MSSNTPKRVGRRRFLQTIGAATLTTGIASAQAGPDGPTFDPRREVPRVHALKHANHAEFTKSGVRPEREPVINTISREKWRLVEAADRARKRVERRLSDLDPTPQVMVEIPQGEDATAPRGLVVQHVTQVANRGAETVAVDSPGYSPAELTEIVKDRFPDTLEATPNTSTHPASPLEQVPRPRQVIPIEGMPIRTEQVRLEKSDHGSGSDHYDRKYRPVPAGCYIEPNGGTLGTPAKDFWGNRLFVTAGHLFMNYSAAHQNRVYDDRLGDVYSGNVVDTNDYDAALITNLDLEPTWQFAAQDSYAYRLDMIRGSRTKEWLKDGQGEGVTLKKQGNTHPLEHGTIEFWSDTKYQSTHPEADGDSGGPHWHTVNIDEAYICGIHESEAYYKYPAKSQATLMSAIEDYFFISV